MRAVVIGCGIGGATAALALGAAAMTELDRVGVADDVWTVGFPVLTPARACLLRS